MPKSLHEELYHTIHGVAFRSTVCSLMTTKKPSGLEAECLTTDAPKPDFVKDFVIRKLTDGWRGLRWRDANERHR